MKVALLTEIPAPYRIPLFNALAATDDVDLEVLFLAERDPRRQYPVYEHEFLFQRHVLPGRGALARGRWVVLSHLEWLSGVSTFEARRFGRAIDEPFVNARSEADVVAAGAGPY